MKKIDESYSNLVSKIEQIKNSANINHALLSEYELKLREMNDLKIKAVLDSNPNFCQLNSERVTPFFSKNGKGITTLWLHVGHS